MKISYSVVRWGRVAVAGFLVFLGMGDVGGLDMSDESVSIVGVVDDALSTVGFDELVVALDVVSVTAFFLALDVVGVGVVDLVFVLVLDWLRGVGWLVVAVGRFLVSVLGAHGGHEGEEGDELKNKNMCFSVKIMI